MNGLTRSHCPVYYPAKPQPRERAWQNQRGERRPCELDSSRLCEMTERCRISGSRRGGSEIPLFNVFYLFRDAEAGLRPPFGSKARPRRADRAEDIVRWGVWLGRHIC
ncbi:uncharacterized protein M6B38_397830 [Iris pallida]|uniref:Uncharacterized protein n=1 Tax=Iris pallida TaxID=29817 RepID=A0AAX6FV74_IRIPA|nr:uncharacterized protein M6B38_397830 [Iris pallida]